MMGTQSMPSPSSGRRRTLPAPVAALVSRLPQLPPSVAFALALNVVRDAIFDRDMLARLEGKVLRLAVRDAGLTLSVSVRSARFHPAFVATAADVTISASALDFLLLAARDEDPDTLFFSRRLTMEGDTELGLALKNALDAVDLSAIAPWLQTVAKFAAA
jgi:O2-independent ubiquinone biosynthesis accessory factor UbiT